MPVDDCAGRRGKTGDFSLVVFSCNKVRSKFCFKVPEDKPAELSAWPVPVTVPMNLAIYSVVCISVPIIPIDSQY
jgi:hypothetical protein